MQDRLDEGKRPRMMAELCVGSLGDEPFDYERFDLPEGPENDKELLRYLRGLKGGRESILDSPTRGSGKLEGRGKAPGKRVGGEDSGLAGLRGEEEEGRVSMPRVRGLRLRARGEGRRASRRGIQLRDQTRKRVSGLPRGSGRRGKRTAIRGRVPPPGSVVKAAGRSSPSLPDTSSPLTGSPTAGRARGRGRTSNPFLGRHLRRFNTPPKRSSSPVEDTRGGRFRTPERKSDSELEDSSESEIDLRDNTTDVDESDRETPRRKRSRLDDSPSPGPGFGQEPESESESKSESESEPEAHLRGGARSSSSETNSPSTPTREQTPLSPPPSASRPPPTSIPTQDNQPSQANPNNPPQSSPQHLTPFTEMNDIPPIPPTEKVTITDAQLASLPPAIRGRVVDMQLRTGNPPLTPSQIASGLRVGWPLQFSHEHFDRRVFLYATSEEVRKRFEGMGVDALREVCRREGLEGWVERGWGEKEGEEVEEGERGYREECVEVFRRWVGGEVERRRRRRMVDDERSIEGGGGGAEGGDDRSALGKRNFEGAEDMEEGEGEEQSPKRLRRA